MRILGIETSCDETAASVVENGRNVISSVVSSQADLHAKTGGVVPEVAARAHVPAIIPVVDQALTDAGLSLTDIDAIAFAECPGLLSALLIGGISAQFLAALSEKPLIPVHHVAGHLYSVYLENEQDILFPRLILTVSGGHNEIVLMRNHFEFEVLGDSLDDSAGEAFDKTARLMGLSYPGGPAIQKAAMNGKPGVFHFPRPMLNDGTLRMSFSGLKTAVLYAMKDLQADGKLKNNPQLISDLALGVQDAIVDVLSSKLTKALSLYPEIREIHLVGGVSANTALRKRLDDLSTKSGLNIYYPKKLSYCTDNAAMIAAAGYFQMQKWPDKYKNYTTLKPRSSMALADYYREESVSNS